MTRKSREIKRPHKSLTGTELEMMSIIWRLGPCSVAQVQEQLLPKRDLAYTSVSTIVRILEQKGYVTSKKEGRGHLYQAAVSKEEYQQMSLTQLVRNVFDGVPSTLVQRLFESETLGPADIAEIRTLLRKKGS